MKENNPMSPEMENVQETPLSMNQLENPQESALQAEENSPVSAESSEETQTAALENSENLGNAEEPEAAAQLSEAETDSRKETNTPSPSDEFDWDAYEKRRCIDWRR